MPAASTPLMPALFLGHGNPMNALLSNEYTESWRKLALELPRPRAIVAVSAHWYQAGSRVGPQAQPRTLHDFGGFPPALFAVQYPAPGAPELARRVAALLAPTPVELDESWGIDHGTWSLLVHMYPEADVPVIQLGIDETLPASGHFALAQKLRALRSEGVLVLGSGNVVHNLHAYGWGRKQVDPYDWGLRFEQTLRAAIVAGEFERVVGYEQLGKDAALSAPTPEHFLPLLYVLALHQAGEPVSFPSEGFDGGSISMLSLRIG